MNGARIVDVSRAVEVFEERFEQPDGRNQRSLRLLISSVLSFYHRNQAEGLVDDDGDMLLFQYGVYDWGLGPFFEIGLTRQFIEVERNDDEHVISQFKLTCFLEPTDELKALGRGKRWCNDPSQMNDFSAWLMHHPILKETEDSPRVRTEVSWELV
jgi:hypothetical protein